MAEEVFSIFGAISLDDKDVRKSLENIDEKAKNTEKSFGKSLGKMASTFAKFAAVTTTAAVGLTGALFGIANKASNTLDRIDKLSQRLGLSREAFQEWEFVLSQAGVSIDSMQSGMKNLSRRMDEANKKVGKGAELFDRIGVSIDESMTQEEAFKETIIGLQELESGVEKAAIAQELFGRSGQNLIPLLNSEADSVDELTKKAHELGLVFSDEQVNAGVVFTDMMDQVKRMLGTLVTRIGLSVIPKFQEWLLIMINNAPKFQAVFGFIAEVAAITLNGMVKIFTISFTRLRAVFNIFQKIFAGDWEEAWTDIVALFADTVDDIINTFEFLWTKFNEKWEENFGKSFKESWDEFWTETLPEKIGPAIQKAWEMALGFMKTKFDNWWNNLVGSAGLILEVSIEWVFELKLFEVLQQQIDDAAAKFGTGKNILLNKLGFGGSGGFEGADVFGASGLRTTAEEINKMLEEEIITPAEARVWGQSTAEGFANGMDDQVGMIQLSAEQMAEVVETGIRNKLQIKSPSKVTEQLGKDTSDGFKNGLEYNNDTITGTVLAMVDKTTAAYERLQSKLANLTTAQQKTVEDFSDGTKKGTEDLLKFMEKVNEKMGVIGNEIGDIFGQITLDLANEEETWEKTMTMFAAMFANVISQMVAEWIAAQITSAAANSTWLMGVIATMSEALSYFLTVAYGALLAFFGFLGPAAPFAAGAVIATAVAAMGALAIKGVQSLTGGGGSSKEPDKPKDTGSVNDSTNSIGSGGASISEITGPTRDLLTDLLRPLAKFNELTGIGNRIYNLLDTRLPDMATVGVGAGISIENINLEVTGDSQEISDNIVDSLETTLANRLLDERRG